MAKLLIHISDRDKWPAALNLAASLMAKTVPESWEIQIIADVFGGGVCVACSRGLRQQMQDFVAAGHRILVCLESLRFLNLKPESLPEFVATIPHSLAEILKLQAEGWQYIKI
jgi:intracellular sulfur oxidation DsrE/DsrF family protein